MASNPSIKIYDSRIHSSLPHFIGNTLSEVFNFRYALKNFVVNNLQTRYRGSILGFVWSLLNPLLLMTVLSVVFSVVFRQDIRVFAIYVFSGLAPWTFIQTSIQAGCPNLINAEGFLKKVYVPKLLFPLVTVTTETVNFGFSIISLYIIALVLGFPIHWTILLLPLAILITYVFNLGLVLLVGVSTVFFRDLAQIMTVVLTALFYTLPIVYPLEMLPPEYKVMFVYNPFYYFIAMFRKVIYGGEMGMGWMDWLIPASLAVLTLALGLYHLYKHDRTLIFRL